jgi:hypothetical protein
MAGGIPAIGRGMGGGIENQREKIMKKFNALGKIDGGGDGIRTHDRTINPITV